MHYNRMRKSGEIVLLPPVAVAERSPYVIKQCSECAVDFNPHGPQFRCTPCRTKSCPCGLDFVTDRRGRVHCSRRCVGRAAANVARLSSPDFNRGVKPRTYAQRERTKHGSAEQREWRTAIFARDAYTCQECGVKGGRLQADHIKPFSTHPDLRYDLSNGRTLCVPCHQATPTYGWRGYWLKRRLSQGVLDFDGAA